MKISPSNLLLFGGIGLGIVAAWELNFLGIRDLFAQVTEDAEELVSPQEQPATVGGVPAGSYPYNYYTGGGSIPQQAHTGQYPFPYPYPPTSFPMTAAPQTLPGAHYQIAGTPNIRQIPGTTTIMNIPNAYMPNPTLWWEKGGIVTPGTRGALPSAINYGPYKFEAPIFSQRRYPIYGTNIDYPFIVPPFCPPDQFAGQDGRCYPTPLYP